MQMHTVHRCLCYAKHRKLIAHICILRIVQALDLSVLSENEWDLSSFCMCVCVLFLFLLFVPVVSSSTSYCALRKEMSNCNDE
ncbi:hypothetical protein T05_10331 [Trichinella murrelli]|uniref:Uncharacterized protein n=1 Tax=Trichinella murrelli TaxID=144512 RepID=A0A0V0U4K6_9BILA|nr:hypothetical protein T05_10331 [Trichinella murrelli]